MDFAVRWEEIRTRLGLLPTDFELQENAIVCTTCRTRFTVLTAQAISRHPGSRTHQNAVLNGARQDPDQNRWENIQRQLQLPADIYTCTDNVVTCKCCSSILHTVTLYHIRKHNNSRKHRQAIDLWRADPEPPAEARARCTSRQNPFWMETCQVLVTSDIPLNKLRDPTFKGWAQKYSRRILPDASTARRYLPKTYAGVLQSIRDEVGDNPIHLSVDETTDKSGRIIANAVVIPLLPDGPGIPRVLHMAELTEANAESICAFVNESLLILWPAGIRHDKVSIYATDAASYMILSATQLKNEHRYTKLVHVTCLCHLFHRVAEAVRSEYKTADKIIATTKAVFKKAPIRCQLFRDVAEDVPLPPEPILTRWGTWIEAASYYHIHFDSVNTVIGQLEDNAACVHKAKRYFEVRNIEEDFHFISEKFQCIADTITHLETRGLSLSQTVDIVNHLRGQLIMDTEIPEKVSAKTLRVFRKNVGYLTMEKVADCIERNTFDQLPAGWTDEDARICRFAPLTSVDVERNFSKYKSILRDNRRSFKFVNLRNHVIVSCFK